MAKYAHSGNSWEPNGSLTDGEVRRELFWSQAIFAEEVGGGVDLTHFVYPNGYMKYKEFLGEFGLESASRYGAKLRKPLDPDFDVLEIDRNNLDEAAWKPLGDAMAMIPAEPEAGSLIIDFTHGMEADPQSVNHRRWVERLGRIASTHGKDGRDTLWSAPTPEILRYVSAAKQGKVSCRRGCVSITLPRRLSDVSLTLQLKGVLENSKISLPGGTVYRKGNEAWITLPALPLASPSKQPLRRIYRGPMQDVKFERDESIAGVRLLQRGRPKPGFKLKISMVKPDGREEALPATTPGETWGFWHLYPILPGRTAILATALKITPDSAFTEMEIWVTRGSSDLPK